MLNLKGLFHKQVCPVISSIYEYTCMCEYAFKTLQGILFYFILFYFILFYFFGLTQLFPQQAEIPGAGIKPVPNL